MEKAMEELRKLDPSDSMEEIIEAISKLLKKVKKGLDDAKAPEALELIRVKEMETRDYYRRPLDDDSIYQELVKIHSERGEVDLVDFYRRSLDLRQARKWTILGDSAGILGDNKRAVKYLRRALFFGPMEDLVDEVRTALEKAEKRVQKAQDQIEKARQKVEDKPDDLKSVKRLLKYLLDLDEVEEAEKITDKALKDHKDDFDLLYTKGRIHFFKDEFEKAKKVFEKCKELDSKSMNAKRAYNWSVEMIENHP